MILQEGEETEWVMSTRQHWLKVEDVNIIKMSWIRGNHGVYSKTVANTPIVARQITLLLHYLAQLNGVDLHNDVGPNIYLVGHSLGAHISCLLVKTFLVEWADNGTGSSLGVVFVQWTLVRANYVDVIHTNSGDITTSLSFGIACPIGHVDYYANDGSRQPG